MTAAVSLVRQNVNGNTAYCQATVTVRNSTTGTAGLLPGATVNGVWTYLPASSTWATALTATDANGKVTFRSANQRQRAGITCVFTISDVTLPGYLLNTAGSVMTRQLAV
jgi:hypothetical protein